MFLGGIDKQHRVVIGQLNLRKISNLTKALTIDSSGDTISVKCCTEKLSKLSFSIT